MKNTILILIISFFSLQQSFAQTELRKKHYNIEKGLAIQGYDPVAYFTQIKAVEGNSKNQVVYDGISYYFVSTTNKDLFLQNPKKYEPQYGGWCAYAMGATNSKVEIDPETFKIINGKLYLYFHNFVNNTLTKWNKDEQNLKTQADKNWASIYK